MTILENKTYDEIAIGDQTLFTKQVTDETRVQFPGTIADLVGVDPRNPARHLLPYIDQEAALLRHLSPFHGMSRDSFPKRTTQDAPARRCRATQLSRSQFGVRWLSGAT